MENQVIVEMKAHAFDLLRQSEEYLQTSQQLRNEALALAAKIAEAERQVAAGDLPLAVVKKGT